LTPQRLHAELLATGASGLEAYLQGALHDATYSRIHRTHRFGQSDRGWLETLQMILEQLGFRSWSYREGRERNYWVVETTAPFLSLRYEAGTLIGSRTGLDYVRGYFDAEGGMPRNPSDRLYLQIGQKDRNSLEVVIAILESHGIACWVHNPSRRVDPDSCRVNVRAGSQQRYMQDVGSWHPRKRQQMETRLELLRQREPHRRSPGPPGTDREIEFW
jgi:hypothetical protein